MLTQRNSVPRMVNVNNKRVTFTFTIIGTLYRSIIKSWIGIDLAHLKKVMAFRCFLDGSVDFRRSFWGPQNIGKSWKKTLFLLFGKKVNLH